MTQLPTTRPLTSLTPAAMLMAVLDVMESPAMLEAVAEAGGVNRPDGVRRAGWQLRFNLIHALPDRGTWVEELEHATAHVEAASTAEELQAALRATAAIAASWALALEVRSQGDDS